MVVASAVDPTNGVATVTPPPTGTWDNYTLTVCEKANPNTCLSNVPDCLVSAPSCPIPNCLPSTTYTVVAVAQRSNGPDSSPSNHAEFTTPIP